MPGQNILSVMAEQCLLWCRGKNERCDRLGSIELQSLLLPEALFPAIESQNRTAFILKLTAHGQPATARAETKKLHRVGIGPVDGRRQQAELVGLGQMFFQPVMNHGGQQITGGWPCGQWVCVLLRLGPFLFLLMQMHQCWHNGAVCGLKEGEGATAESASQPWRGLA